MAGAPHQQDCYRCEAPLDDVCWARISTTHEDDDNRYADVERRICVDCLAGIGLLAFARERRNQSTRSRLRSHLSSASPLHEQR